MKILYVTTIGGTMKFFKDFICSLLSDGHTVDIVANENRRPVAEYYREWGCKVYNIPFSRNPFSKSNIQAYRDLKSLVKKENYDIVHCHTPVAAMCTRFACRKLRRKGTKVFYTAHGFHFYKGAPLKNWLIYYPVEKICSYFTDVLITINKEDYALAQKKMKAKRVEYVAGVGIDTKRFSSLKLSDEQKSELRKEIGVPENAKLLLSVGELNENKNQKATLEALSLLDEENIYYVVAGTGNKEDYLKNLAKELGLEERFYLLGHRDDVPQLYNVADCFAHPSFREGLPVSVMEAMASGLPCVVSKIRGNEDLVEDGVNGFLCNPFNSNEFANAIGKLMNDIELHKKMSQANADIAEEFATDNINQKMLIIYQIFGEENENF